VSSTIVESQILLLDIEGTTTPVNFVYKTLFPYARRKLESFILEHFREAEIASLIRQLHMQHDTDDSQGLQPPSWIHEQVESRLRSCIEFCKWLTGQTQKGNPSQISPRQDLGDGIS
jgi:methionine salvage enolase-phosphatase E1